MKVYLVRTQKTTFTSKTNSCLLLYRQYTMQVWYSIIRTNASWTNIHLFLFQKRKIHYWKSIQVTKTVLNSIWRLWYHRHTHTNRIAWAKLNRSCVNGRGCCDDPLFVKAIAFISAAAAAAATTKESSIHLLLLLTSWPIQSCQECHTQNRYSAGRQTDRHVCEQSTRSSSMCCHRIALIKPISLKRQFECCWDDRAIRFNVSFSLGFIKTMLNGLFKESENHSEADTTAS